MTVRPQALWGPRIIGMNPQELYKSDGVTTMIARAVFNNILASDVGLFVWVARDPGLLDPAIPLVGTAGSGGLVLTAGPDEPYVVSSLAQFVLEPGDKVWAAADADQALVTIGSGWTQT